MIGGQPLAKGEKLIVAKQKKHRLAVVMVCFAKGASLIIKKLL